MTSVHVETGEVVDVLSEQEARELTEKIADGLGEVWSLIKRAYLGRAWVPMGFGSWDEYVDKTFGATRIRLPREERQEVVASLRDSGLSIRAIATATGSSVGTVSSDLNAGVQNRTPDEDGPREPDIAPLPDEPAPPPITGIDGKSYQPSRPAPSDRSLIDDLRDNDDAAMKRHLHKIAMTALVGFGEPRKYDPARVARALPERDNERVIDLLDEVENWLAAYRSALTSVDELARRRAQ